MSSGKAPLRGIEPFSGDRVLHTSFIEVFTGRESGVAPTEQNMTLAASLRQPGETQE